MGCFNMFPPLCSSSSVKEKKLPHPVTSFSFSQLISPQEKDLTKAQESTLFKYKSHLRIGEVNRITIKYTHDPSQSKKDIFIEKDKFGEYIWLRLKNEQNPLVRPIYITGPFTFYVDCRPCNYHSDVKFKGEPIAYNIDVKPNQAFKCKLYLNKNSLYKQKGQQNEQSEGDIHLWTLDIVSQLAVITQFSVDYEVSIGYSYPELSTSIPYDHQTCYLPRPELISVDVAKTEALWNHPPLRPQEPVHLVIITHGIFSNIGADMLYVKDQLEERFQQTGENAIVRGFAGNIGKSERGIKFLGKRVGEYVVEYVKEQRNLFVKSEGNEGLNITKISFIGHSLGGCTQAYAIYHIATNYPRFFIDFVKPTYFICIASPMVGILTEFSKTVSLALDLGFFAETGRDLMLRHQFSSLVQHKFKKLFGNKKTKLKDQEEKKKRSGLFTMKPVLEQIIMSDAAHKVFCAFEKRTTYANAVNDGIVPLRTAALVYLNWQGLDDFQTVKAQILVDQKREKDELGEDFNSGIITVPTVERLDSSKVGEIPNENSITAPIHLHPYDKDDEEITEESSTLNKPLSTTVDFITNTIPSLLTNIKPPNLVIDDTKSKKVSKRKLESYRRTQTTGSGSTTLEETIDSNFEEKPQQTEEPRFNIPPAASTMVTAANVLFALEPSQKYFTEPKYRNSPIFHDSIYSYEDLPPSSIESGKDNNPWMNKIRHTLDRRLQTQEKMARQWHKGMTWRKVLVVLKPDAHNNIIVRRRMTNGWGWGVIDHMVKEHF